MERMLIMCRYYTVKWNISICRLLITNICIKNYIFNEFGTI